MNTYIIVAMFKHIVRTVFPTIIFKESKNVYDIRLININEKEAILNAILISTIFFVIATALIVYIRGDRILITFAGLLLAIAFAQQLISVCIDAITTNLNNFISTWNSTLYTLSRIRKGDEWRYVENESNRIFIYPHIIFTLPSTINEPKISSNKLIKYLVDHKDEINYPHAIYDFEPSLLAFSQYLIEYLHGKLLLYDRLTNVQQITGTVNPILFLAIGEIIWLLVK